MDETTKFGLSKKISDMICYLNFFPLPIFALIVFFTKGEEKQTRVVAGQSLLLFISTYIISIPLYLLNFVFTLMHFNTIVSLIVFLQIIVAVLRIVFFILLGAISFTGHRVKIPFLGNLSENIIDKISKK